MRREAIDAAIAVIVALDDAAQWRELPEVWAWAQQLAEHPALEHHPRAAAALATASDFVWLQGDLARAGELADAALARATDDDGRWRGLLAVSVAQLSNGQFRAATESASGAAELAPRPEHARWVAALAAAYGGDLEAAATMIDSGPRRTGITPQAEREYTVAEIASITGNYSEAEDRYRRAIELATTVGSSFVVGIASVGLLTVLRATGRHADALAGYRDVITYWAHAGNWIQVWATLRDLASLLAELGDDETARTLLVAADHAPDAPAVGDSAWERPEPAPEDHPVDIATRDESIDAALRAIDRHLDRR